MLRLFTSGTHNSLTFTNEQINGIFEKSKDGENIPVVLGHPKNDLPVVGWVKRTALKLYGEGDKQSIGFEKEDADFSTESIDAIKELGRDKISVRLKNGAITHIGLVKVAAVDENNNQDFEQQEEIYINAVDNIDFSKNSILKMIERGVEKGFEKSIKSIFKNNKKESEMTEEDKKKLADLEAENAKLKKEQEDKDAAQKVAEETAAIDGFKTEFSKPEYKGKFDFEAALRVATSIVKAGNPIMDFAKDGATVKVKALDDFSVLLKAVPSKLATVKQGSIFQDFSKGGEGDKPSALDVIKANYEQVK